MTRECHVRFCEGGGVRFPSATRLVIMARYVSKRMWDWMGHLLEDRMGLTVNREKSRQVQVGRDGNGSLDFLGYTFRYVRSRYDRSQRYLAMRPSRKAILRLHDRIRALTHKRWGLLPASVLVESVNSYLRGWKSYFGRGHRGKIFSKIDYYVSQRLMSHFQRRSHKGLRPPEGLSWYQFLVCRLGLCRVSGGLSRA